MSAQTFPQRPRLLHLPLRTASIPTQDVLIASEDLLNGRKEVVIQHGDRLYRLRHTSNDKLILTK